MKPYVISISREYGSGGRLIGKQLAQQLGIPCYDRTIIQKAAEKSGLSPDFIARAGERLRGRFRLPVPAGGGNPAFSDQSVPASQQAFFAQSEVILELADQGPCVIVGRCADHVLESKHVDCLSLFICAPFDWRVHHRMEIENVDEKTAAALVEKTDKQREKYYTHYTARPWGLPENYDLCINSARLGIDRTASLLAQHCRELFNDLP